VNMTALPAGRMILADSVVAPAEPEETRSSVITPFAGARYGAEVCHTSWFAGPQFDMLSVVVWTSSVAAEAGAANAMAADTRDYDRPSDHEVLPSMNCHPRELLSRRTSLVSRTRAASRFLVHAWSS
jgi:hypothetical protein